MAIPLLYHRITKSYFRTCSTRRCRSQAPFCLCTLQMVSNHSEGTFERLRYPFRRRPPQSNSPPDIVPLPVHGNWLETQYYRVVSQQRLRTDWRPSFFVSHLSCTCSTESQYQTGVKLHGVFPSWRG